jgi:plastocyanin
VAFLHFVRVRGDSLRVALRRSPLLAWLAASVLVAACAPERDPSLQPDEVLQAQLGLTLDDRVYRVAVSGGQGERADPAALSIEPGAYVQFVTSDWLVHEVLFETDSLGAAQRAFLERTHQVASPPMIDRDSRYVLSFVDAPPGRYSYRLEGNGRPARGVIVVADPAESAGSR